MGRNLKILHSAVKRWDTLDVVVLKALMLQDVFHVST